MARAAPAPAPAACHCDAGGSGQGGDGPDDKELGGEEQAPRRGERPAPPVRVAVVTSAERLLRCRRDAASWPARQWRAR